MALQAVLDSIDGVAEALAEHYEERDGKFHLKVSGMIPSSDGERMNATINALRTEKAGLTDKLGKWGALGDDPASVQALLDEIPALKKAAEVGGGGDVLAKAKELAAEQVEVFRKQAEREKAEFEKTIAERDASIAEFQTRETHRRVDDELRAAAAEAKVIPSAIDDLLLHRGVFEVNEDGKVVTRDGVGCAPGIDPSVWLTEHLEKRPHLLPPSKGGGAKGAGGGPGDGGNPWSRRGWNPTEQHRIARQDRSRAEQLANAAGSKIGAIDPPGKPEGSKDD